jgi:hypothetical protein
MYLKLSPNYVHPRTHASLPNAVLYIADTEFRMRAGDTRITALVYADADLIDRAAPVDEFQIALSVAERNTQMPSLLLALYTVVSQRAEYAGSTLIVEG